MVHANNTSKLNFTDIVNGLDTGLGDGLGSEALVTLWGNNLGTSQNKATVKFRAYNGSVNNSFDI